MNIALTPEVEELLSTHAPVAIGVSGGKDSQAAAIATVRHLREVGHSGPVILIHAHLGLVEWRDSLPACRRTADFLGLPLVVVERKAGGMMERWESRWESSVRRYQNLETVTLVLPWSTPSMRFCTSELKADPIEAYLRKEFRTQKVVSVSGVRRQESLNRARQSVGKMSSCGKFYDWRPLSDWTVDQVFAYVREAGLMLHEGYLQFGLSRVSCAFCIMSNAGDLRAAVRVPETRALYNRMVRLETRSGFAFQGSTWLGDLAPDLLDEDVQLEFPRAKTLAAARQALEMAITPAMKYVKGWPTRMLTDEEAGILATTRRAMSELYGFDSVGLDVEGIHTRYATLMAERDLRAKKKRRK